MDMEDPYIRRIETMMLRLVKKLNKQVSNLLEKNKAG